MSDLLGRGVYGEVRRVEYEGKNYAKKFISELRCLNSVEIDLMSRIYHPSIIRAVSFNFTENREKHVTGIEILMPLATTVLNKIDLTSFSYEKKMRFIYEITSALYFLHEAGAYHCDLKADNILIFKDKDDEMRPVLADLGVSSYRDSTFIEVCSSPTLASPETLIVIYGEQIPREFLRLLIEQLPDFGHDNIYDRQRFDPILNETWSLAMLIYYIFTKTYPYNVSSLTINYLDFLNNKESLNRVPEDWQEILGRMFEKDPNKRMMFTELFRTKPFMEFNYTNPIKGYLITNIIRKEIPVKYKSMITQGLNIIADYCVITKRESQIFVYALDLFHRAISTLVDEMTRGITIEVESHFNMFAIGSIYLACCSLNRSPFNFKQFFEIALKNYRLRIPSERIILDYSSIIMEKLNGRLYVKNAFTEAFSKASLNKTIGKLLDIETYPLDILEYMRQLEEEETAEERENRESKYRTYLYLNEKGQYFVDY
jgi:Serine/threonine protein kinase